MAEEFEAVVDRCQRSVFTYARYFLNDQESAEDVTQDVFMKLWRHWDAIDFERVDAWLMRVTRNACYDALRGRRTASKHVTALPAAALDAQADDPTPSATISDTALDDGQHASASAVAGHDRLVLVVGPAGAGKTRMLQAAVSDLHAQRRAVMGLAPTAKAARVLETETGMPTDTVAKLLYELDRPDSDDSWWDAGPGMTVIVEVPNWSASPSKSPPKIR